MRGEYLGVLMANPDGSINTQYMNLPNPVPSVTPGTSYATDLYNSLTIVDAHNHTSGQGQLVPVAGLNMNATLPMNDNIISTTQSINFVIQTSNPSTSASLFFKGVDLYVKDGNGNIIQMTAAGAVLATSSGISSGNNIASFSGNTLVVQNTATPIADNIDVGSVILRNNSGNSTYGVTLSPVNSLGSNYSLTLPSVPAQTNVMTLDNSGNMGSATYDTIAAAFSATGANAIAATMTSTGTSSIVATMTTANADTIASKMDSTGANAIAASMSNPNIGGTYAQINSYFAAISNTNASYPLSLLVGKINSNGTVDNAGGTSAGISCSYSAGVYSITYTTSFYGGAYAVPVVTPLGNASTFYLWNITGISSIGFSVAFAQFGGGGTQTAFTFLVIGQQ